MRVVHIVDVNPLAFLNIGQGVADGLAVFDDVLALLDVPPVSYTHLDVYKRQRRDGVILNIFGGHQENLYAHLPIQADIFANLKAIVPGVRDVSWVESGGPMNPVSYTHLGD